MPVGEKLAALRRERGKSLPEIESSTKIMGRMLSALENERWDELPAPVYVRGYIRSYAQAIGVDPEPLLEEYTRDTSTPHTEHVPLRSIPERTVVPHRLELHALPRQVWIAVAIAVLVVALLVWGISALVSRDDTPPPIAPEATSTVSTPTPEETVSEAVTGAVSETAFILKVEVAQAQSSWLQVRVDGLVAYEGTLPGGEPKMWTVTDTAVVRVGKPAAVTITRDGQAVPIPAATDGIAEVTLATATE